MRKIDELRAEQELFKCNSFATIIGFNRNAAIIHYHPEATTNAPIKGSGVLLADSGGHYLDGTTDVTRTIAVGTPTDKQKLMYTLVLKGHIALHKAVFPIDTPCSALDSLARQFLWQYFLDYEHETGHGVGHYSAVHESPPFIGKKINNMTLQPNMLVTIEPGVYLQNEFGIRIENTALIQHYKHRFCGFRPLTMAPYDKNLMDFDILNHDEINYIKKYHNDVVQTMEPLLEKETTRWLKDFIQIL